MSQQQGRITDSLASVIQIIQMEGRTGELRTGRGEGVNTEIGSIIFRNGQIVSAQLGSYTGPVAFNILKTWGRCIFIFSPSKPTHALQQNSPAQDRPEMLPARRYVPAPVEKSSETYKGSLFPSTAIPRSTMSIVKAITAIEKAGLSRIYRQVILLIDGRHAVSDLIMNIGCTPEEMQQILQTLERLTLIRVPR